jgi:hypothetical protein
MRRGDYGYDAPYAPAMFGVLSVVSALGAAVVLAAGAEARGRADGVLLRLLPREHRQLLHTTRRGKFLEWERILEKLRLRGDERVLDMGCGRGAVLTAVAAG